jgi:hypothetical protein
MANGPLLALFVIAAFLPGIGGAAALWGFVVAIALNLCLWLFLPELSWLWWNPIGCGAAIAVAVLAGGARALTLPRLPAPPRQLATVLTLAFVAMGALLVAMQGIHG